RGGAGDGLLRIAPQRLGLGLCLDVLGDRAEVAAGGPREVAGAQGALGVLHHRLGEDQRRHVVLHRSGTPCPLAGRERRVALCDQRRVETRRHRVRQQLVQRGARELGGRGRGGGGGGGGAVKEQQRQD